MGWRGFLPPLPPSKASLASQQIDWSRKLTCKSLFMFPYPSISVFEKVKLSYPNTHPDLSFTEWPRFLLGFLILSDKGVRQLIDAELSWNSQMSLYVDSLSRWSYEFDAVHSPARDIPVICNLDVVVNKTFAVLLLWCKEFPSKTNQVDRNRGVYLCKPRVRGEPRRRVCQNYGFLRLSKRGEWVSTSTTTALAMRPFNQPSDCKQTIIMSQFKYRKGSFLSPTTSIDLS